MLRLPCSPLCSSVGYDHDVGGRSEYQCRTLAIARRKNLHHFGHRVGTAKISGDDRSKERT